MLAGEAAAGGRNIPLDDDWPFHHFHTCLLYTSRQTDFVDQVLAVLADTGANPQRLKLELTESLLVSNVEDIIAKMTLLKSKGCLLYTSRCV